MSSVNTLTRIAGIPDTLHAYAFPRWKWPVLRQCFPGRQIVFVAKDAPLPKVEALLLWGTMPVPDGLAADALLLRIEDGFMRSVGLGADIVRPMSWVVDAQGIYYDATRPSDLESLLALTPFNDAQRARAAALRERILAAGLTKYNVGAKRWQRPAHANHVVLVVGQVESDASIAFGAPGERSNIGLLRNVRAAHPDAYLLYKPHPDVLARLRLQGQGEELSTQYCDEIVTDVAMGELLNVVDEVHVLTSLAGFEALLRGKKVVCHGQPFYAGWGLTTDIIPHPRRSRRLLLDELVTGALIEYPLYLSRDGKQLITPEQALDVLAAWREKTGGKEPWWRDIYRVFLRRIAGVR